MASTGAQLLTTVGTSVENPRAMGAQPSLWTVSTCCNDAEVERRGSRELSAYRNFSVNAT